MFTPPTGRIELSNLHPLTIHSQPLRPAVRRRKSPSGILSLPYSKINSPAFTRKHRSLPGSGARRAIGRCDVVVYGPEAAGNLHLIGQHKRRLLIEAWIDRYQALFDQGCKYVLPFENRGDAVGVTLAHPHGQIYAFPFIPRVQQDALQAFREGYDLSGYIQSHKGDFGVASTGGIEAFCPSYARFPYEVWLAPQIRKAGPWAFTEEEKDGFAHLLGDVTRRYDAYFEAPTAYMLSLHAAPLGHEKSWHFTAQFYPLLRAPGRVKYLASVEQSTGTFTVDVMPEAAAKILRDL
jgi:UDPglucose--hexose-1-phosphate uridylyltransferase